MVAKFLDLNNLVPERNDRNGLSQESLLTSTDFATTGLLTPTSSNIENWWGRDDKWCHSARHMMSFVTKNLWKRCCWNCNIWPYWFTSHQSHYCLYYKSIPEFVRKCLMLRVQIAQIRQNMWNFIVRKSNLQEIANFGDYPGGFRL